MGQDEREGRDRSCYTRGLLQAPYPGRPSYEVLRQIEAASHPQALVLMGDFNHPHIC